MAFQMKYQRKMQRNTYETKINKIHRGGGSKGNEALQCWPHMSRRASGARSSAPESQGANENSKEKLWNRESAKKLHLILVAKIKSISLGTRAAASCLNCKLLHLPLAMAIAIMRRGANAHNSDNNKNEKNNNNNNNNNRNKNTVTTQKSTKLWIMQHIWWMK